ncbi:MAG: hypothetical protein ACRD22_21845, partial [Terriglobia bacterium]
VLSSAVQKLDEHWPGGYFPVEPTHGLDDYFRFLDGLVEASGVKKWMAENAPKQELQNKPA